MFEFVSYNTNYMTHLGFVILVNSELQIIILYKSPMDHQDGSNLDQLCIRQALMKLGYQKLLDPFGYF